MIANERNKNCGIVEGKPPIYIANWNEVFFFIHSILCLPLFYYLSAYGEWSARANIG